VRPRLLMSTGCPTPSTLQRRTIMTVISRGDFCNEPLVGSDARLAEVGQRDLVLFGFIPEFGENVSACKTTSLYRYAFVYTLA